jgi:hypothetical protein
MVIAVTAPLFPILNWIASLVPIPVVDCNIKDEDAAEPPANVPTVVGMLIPTIRGILSPYISAAMSLVTITAF